MLAKGAGGDVPFGQSSPFLSYIPSGTYYANLSTLMGSPDDAATFQKNVLAGLDTSVTNICPSKDPAVIDGYKVLYNVNAQRFLNSPIAQVELLFFTLGNIGGGDQQTLSIQIALQHPYSQGRLYITTNDAFDDPALDPQYLSHSADVVLMRQGLKLARKIAATSPLKDVLGQEVAPGPAVTSDDAIDDFVANGIVTEFHPANTLAMLPRSQGGVVDAKLRVYGLQNVRVVDASIFPLQFAAHVRFYFSSRSGTGADFVAFVDAMARLLFG